MQNWGEYKIPMGMGGGGTAGRGKITIFFFFCLEATCVLTPLPVPTEILFSPQFQSHQETNMAARQTQ